MKVGVLSRMTDTVDSRNRSEWQTLTNLPEVVYLYFAIVRIYSFYNTYKNWAGSSIKDFEDDSGCTFEDDSSDVIPHLMRNPGSISFQIESKNEKRMDPQSSWGWQVTWILDKRFRGWQKCCHSALDAESRKYFFLLILVRKRIWIP